MPARTTVHMYLTKAETANWKKKMKKNLDDFPTGLFYWEGFFSRATVPRN